MFGYESYKKRYDCTLTRKDIDMDTYHYHHTGSDWGYGFGLTPNFFKKIFTTFGFFRKINIGDFLSIYEGEKGNTSTP